jgi:hypothetical protein
MSGLAEAFRAFGATPRNVRWSWSARTPDGRVIMTFWKDRFLPGSKPLSYSNFGSPTLAEWHDQLGNQERIENLKWAQDHCGGLMNVVIVVAEDESANPRHIADSYPRKNLIMKLTRLDDKTGEFSAINVNN